MTDIYATYRLTQRHREVCELLLTGASNDEIAAALFIEPGTVKNYITDINRRLGTSSRLQIALVVAGVIPAPPVDEDENAA